MPGWRWHRRPRALPPRRWGWPASPGLRESIRAVGGTRPWPPTVPRARPRRAGKSDAADRVSAEMTFARTVVLGAIAGSTIFLGLPIGRLRNPRPRLKALLNAVSAGILVFLLFDILKEAT